MRQVQCGVCSPPQPIPVLLGGAFLIFRLNRKSPCGGTPVVNGYFLYYPISASVMALSPAPRDRNYPVSASVMALSPAPRERTRSRHSAYSLYRLTHCPGSGEYPLK
jgi:hypothetical protein